MSLILSLDTSNDTCTISLARYGQVMASHQHSMKGPEASSMALFVQEIFEEQDIDPLELNAVAVGCGPGSYTGLRIGVSFAKGLCYGTSVPLIAVGSLDIWAQSLLHSEARHTIENLEGATLAPMIDARRMEVYTALYSGAGKPLTHPWAEVIDEESFADYRQGPFVIFGGGAAKCQESMPWAQYVDVQIAPEALSLLAQRKYDRGELEDMASYEPDYLKEYVVTKSKKKIF